jgi:DNA-binding transcriptional ArsR family regulator
MTAIPAHPPPGADFAPVAALMGDTARAAMLTALLDDRALAAGELANLAGVSPATASEHLTRLLGGGLVTVASQGRHRYYRLAGHRVAAAIEALSQLSPPAPVRSLRQSRQAAALAQARTCYDHLAGQAGVALLDALLARGVLADGMLADGRGNQRPGPRRRRSRTWQGSMSRRLERPRSLRLASMLVPCVTRGAGSRAPAWTGRSAART